MINRIINDGYASYLVKGATFIGKYQMPRICKHSNLAVPKDMIPFDKRKKLYNKDTAVHFYMFDKCFKQILKCTKKYVEELSKFKCVISPDFSLYRDMPLCLQITNTYLNRAVNYYLQSQGIYVIPNVRWGDERSFEFCFDGLPKNDIVSISTYGCIRGKINKYYFKLGLNVMLNTLKPKIVLVHGSMPNEVFSDYSNLTQFIQYSPLISRVRRKKNNG